MWTGVSNRFGDALRADVAIWSTATHKNLVTGVTTDLVIVDGSVTDDATGDVRRTLTMSLPGSSATWNVLNTQGGEITVTQTVEYADQSVETIPMGVFIVDQESLGYSPEGTIDLTCPDRWLKVQRNKFGLSRSSVPSNTVWQEIDRLLRGAWPGSTYLFPGWATGSPDKTATGKVGAIAWDDGDRAAAIMEFVQANGLELFPDRQGRFVLRQVPQLTPSSVPAWKVDSSATGVMIDASRQRDRSNLRNAVIATTSATDIVFPPQEVKYLQTGDPLSVDGPLGYVPEDWSSVAFRNSAQAVAAAQVRLRKRLGNAQSVSLTALSNPALDSNDVIAVLYPSIDPNQPPVYELHILDSVTHPLQPSGTQEMATRSTRPLTDGT